MKNLRNVRGLRGCHKYIAILTTHSCTIYCIACLNVLFFLLLFFLFSFFFRLSTTSHPETTFHTIRICHEGPYTWCDHDKFLIYGC